MNTPDKQAFEAIFREYYPQLCAYAFQILQQREDAEEIVQDLFVQLWQKGQLPGIHSSLKAYLFRAVHNHCLNQIRSQKVRQEYASRFRAENPDHEIQEFPEKEPDENLVKLRQALEALPPERKKIFMMIRFEERKYKEVAELLGISVKTVENQMVKAMHFLRSRLYLFFFVCCVLFLFLNR